MGLIDNLESAVRKLKWQLQDTEWADYYEDTNYSLDALHRKKQLVREDIFYDYTQQVFEREFGRHFTIEHCVKIRDSERILYLMRKR